MNDTITTGRSLDLDRRHTVQTDVRVTLADRLSVRLGLWLLLRTERRVDRARDVDVRARSEASRRAREAHELTVLRAREFGARIY